MTFSCPNSPIRRRASFAKLCRSRSKMLGIASGLRWYVRLTVALPSVTSLRASCGFFVSEIADPSPRVDSVIRGLRQFRVNGVRMHRNELKFHWRVCLGRVVTLLAFSPCVLSFCCAFWCVEVVFSVLWSLCNLVVTRKTS